jgi:hypothetical protein
MRTRSALRAAGLGLLLLGGCTVPPVVLNDGLPAWTTAPNHGEWRGGVSALYWNYPDDSRPLPIPNFGFRGGDNLGPFCTEGGAQFYYYVPSVHLGIGLRRPAVMLRGAIIAPILGPFGPWWQASLLVGTGQRKEGYSFSAGPRASNLGLGLGFIGEYTRGNSTFRLDVTGSGRAPWADTSVAGQVFSLGLWYGHAIRNTQQGASLGHSRH